MKTFKLPKEFTEQWLEALRSGTYKQGDEFLMCETADETDTVNGKQYCCLGVAGVVCGVNNMDLAEHNFLSDIDRDIIEDSNLPSELISDSGLANILASMNDGYSVSAYKGFLKQYPNIVGLINPEETVSAKIKYTFEEICIFIEANVELI